MEPWSKSTDATQNARLFSATAATALLVSLLAAMPGGVSAARAKASPAPTPYGAVVPEGVDVPVELVTQINSATFQVGDNFQFKTTKDAKLGDMVVPQGTGGHGRVASVARATDKQNGSVALQVDSLDLSNGTPVWVNIDPKAPVQGHLADKHTHFLVVAISTDFSGNMVLEPGTPFKVVTTSRRAAPAPLLTAAPTPEASALPSGTPPTSGPVMSAAPQMSAPVPAATR